MQWGSFGRWMMLAGSLALGVLAGIAAVWIFEFKVPDAARSRALAAEVRLYFLVGGLFLGFLIYAWTRAAAGIALRAGASRGRREGAVPEPAPTPQPPLPPAGMMP